MSKFISGVLTVFTLGLAFFFDLVAAKLQYFIDKYVNAIPYVLHLVFFNLIIVALCLLQAWLVLIRSERSIFLSGFLILITGSIGLLLPLIIVSPINPSFLGVLRPSEIGRNFIEQVYFPMIKAGPRSYLSFFAMFVFGVSIVNLFRKNEVQPT